MERITETGVRIESDEDDLVLELGGVNDGLFARVNLILGDENVPQLIRAVRRIPLRIHGRRAIVDQHRELILGPRPVVDVSHGLARERNRHLTDANRLAVEHHVTGLDAAGAQRRRDSE